ncbi:acyl-homoserine-lactone synthase [Burkholderia sp. Ac-20353]|uniref:acyl-homoserine-lactone synthase n=1 Tax=Burkholderia sp. Ac-20353 TaxID=2703894 RepID=UPI00197B2429|nr:acyl-homoserine-lactone synthase [Burkholderia sp. Ac-20353]MBN3787480.1 N-acyl homoserine lactone synthase [Burkholderia sp. Ac-20353]
MFDIVAGRLNDLPFEIRHELGAYRHEVFVRRLGWSLPSAKENTTVEWDRFDDGDTVQIVALDLQRQICGSARLISTVGPYLLQDLLPSSVALALPTSPTVWELSRFAASITHGPTANATSGMQLFPYVLAIATALGATRIIGVVTRAIARLYRRFGLDLHSIGPDHGTSEFPFIVCTIELTSLTFAELGDHPNKLLNTIMWFGSRASKTPPGMRSDSNATVLPSALHDSRFTV